MKRIFKTSIKTIGVISVTAPLMAIVSCSIYKEYSPLDFFVGHNYVDTRNDGKQDNTESQLRTAIEEKYDESVLGFEKNFPIMDKKPQEKILGVLPYRTAQNTLIASNKFSEADRDTLSFFFQGIGVAQTKAKWMETNLLTTPNSPFRTGAKGLKESDDEDAVFFRKFLNSFYKPGSDDVIKFDSSFTYDTQFRKLTSNTITTLTHVLGLANLDHFKPFTSLNKDELVPYQDGNGVIHQKRVWNNNSQPNFFKDSDLIRDKYEQKHKRYEQQSSQLSKDQSRFGYFGADALNFFTKGQALAASSTTTKAEPVTLNLYVYDSRAFDGYVKEEGESFIQNDYDEFNKFVTQATTPDILQDPLTQSQNVGGGIKFKIIKFDNYAKIIDQINKDEYSLAILPRGIWANAKTNSSLLLQERHLANIFDLGFQTSDDLPSHSTKALELQTNQIETLENTNFKHYMEVLNWISARYMRVTKSSTNGENFDIKKIILFLKDELNKNTNYVDYFENYHISSETAENMVGIYLNQFDYETTHPLGTFDPLTKRFKWDVYQALDENVKLESAIEKNRKFEVESIEPFLTEYQTPIVFWNSNIVKHNATTSILTKLDDEGPKEIANYVDWSINLRNMIDLPINYGVGESFYDFEDIGIKKWLESHFVV